MEKINSSFVMNSIHSTLSLAKQLSYQYLAIFARLLGASGLEVGLLTAGQNISQTALQGFFGRLSDLYGRRKFMITGFVLAGISFFMAAFSQSPLELIVMTFVNGIALSILSPSWEGTIGDNTSDVDRGSVIGKLNSFATYYSAFIIFVLGLISLSLEKEQQIIGYRAIVAFSGINFLAGALLSLRVKEERANTGEVKERRDLFEPLRNKRFRKFLFVILTWWFSMSIAWSYFPIYLGDVLKLSIYELGLVNVVFSLVMAFVANYFGPIVDDRGPKIALVIGFGTFWIFPIFLALSTTFPMILLANAFAGFSLGIGIPAIQTYIIEVAGPDRTGQYSGTYYFFWGIVTFGGSLLGGYLLDFLIVFRSLKSVMFSLLIGVGIFRFVTGMFLLVIEDTRNPE